MRHWSGLVDRSCVLCNDPLETDDGRGVATQVYKSMGEDNEDHDKAAGE